jgi:hypothetical protein
MLVVRIHFEELTMFPLKNEDWRISPWLAKNYIYIEARWAFIVWGQENKGRI